MECYTCESISGLKRISPGPTICEGQYWLLEHAYPSRLKGWLVLIVKRHVEALHDLSRDEFVELAELQTQAIRILHAELDCEKEYVACFAKADHFQHIHFHLVAKPRGWPSELKGTKIFAMLNTTEAEAVTPHEIRDFCKRLRSEYTWT